MVSIRCEAKHVHTHDYRRLGVPHTLLNVGIRQCSKGAMSHCSPENIERMSALLVNNYRCRLSLLEEQVGPLGLGEDASWFEETLMLLEAIYAQLRLVAQAGSLFPTSIIVQRMVFGNLTPASGSGFVCSHNPFTQIDDDFGVFLPCQQGFSLKGGRWGDNEVAFGDLREINPRAYFQIKGISYCLSRAFGGYRHIEFTIEDKSVYVLDHTTRDVTHQVPTPKSRQA